MIEFAAAILVGLPAGLFLYAYVVYPLALQVLSKLRGPANRGTDDPEEWPLVSISLPAHDEEDTIRGALDALLEADYPDGRLQIVVVSDASTDRTEDIVRGYADRGVELLRLEERGGKTRAENAAVPYLRGDLVVNTDASVRILPDALKALVRQFADPGVGVASGRDVSVGAGATGGAGETGANPGEAGYVGYEMWVRSLETRLGGIVGASGCLYAIRADLHRRPVPGHLSRDFAAALTAREAGFRSVSVDEAICLVPRSSSLKGELRRKARTMARGIGTLFHKGHLLDPVRHGGFAWKLGSHKLCRWMAAGTSPLVVPGLAILAPDSPLALGGLAMLAAAGVAGGAALLWPHEDIPSPLAAFGYVLAAVLAAVMAWGKVFRGQGTAVWSPTRR